MRHIPCGRGRWLGWHLLHPVARNTRAGAPARSLSVLASKIPRCPERYETLATLVPQDERYAAKALDECDASDLVQFRMVSHHFWQSIERDAAAQVVDVVQSDVGCQPMKHLGQIVVRTAVQRRLNVAPVGS